MKNKVYVVEGIHDENKLRSIYPDIKVVSVNGSEINEDKVSLLKELSKEYEIVLVLDPDYPGTKIRHTLESILGSVTHIYFDKKDAISKNQKKVGVEHIDDNIIKEKLLFEIKENNLVKSDLTYHFLYEIGIVGSNSKKKRELITNHYHLGKQNGKSLLKKLIWLGIKKEDIKKVLNNE